MLGVLFWLYLYKFSVKRLIWQHFEHQTSGYLWSPSASECSTGNNSTLLESRIGKTFWNLFAQWASTVYFSFQLAPPKYYLLNRHGTFMPYRLHHLLGTVYNQVCLDLKLVPAFHFGHLAVLRHEKNFLALGHWIWVFPILELSQMKNISKLFHLDHLRDW